jgi:hypothetical protein
MNATTGSSRTDATGTPARIDGPAARQREVRLHGDQPSLPEALAARVERATLEGEVALGKEMDFAAESRRVVAISGHVRCDSQITEIGFDGNSAAIAATTSRATGCCAWEEHTAENLGAGSGRNGDDAADAAIACADCADLGLQCTRGRLTDD